MNNNKVNSPPKFLKKFEDLDDLIEEESAVFESPIEPADDETLKYEWYLNNKPVTISSRHDTFLEDGVVGLCINPVYKADCGMYTCVLSNAQGNAQQSAKLECKDIGKTVDTHPFRRSSIVHSTSQINPDDILKALKNRTSLTSLASDNLVVTKALKPQYTVDEDTNLIMSLEYDVSCEDLAGDWDIEWTQNNQPLRSSSRIEPIFEYGVIGLRIHKITSCDAGVYNVKIFDKNDGEDHRILIGSYKTNLIVNADPNVVRDPICLNSLMKIKELEAYSNASTRYISLNPNSLEAKSLHRAEVLRSLIQRRKSSIPKITK